MQYGLLKTTAWTKGSSGQAINSTYGTIGLNPGAYERYTFASGVPGDTPWIESLNVFKKPAGFLGSAISGSTFNPMPGLGLEFWTSDGRTRLGRAVTDADGYYLYSYKHTGKRPASREDSAPG
jgi:hypothetical protein